MLCYGANHDYPFHCYTIQVKKKEDDPLVYHGLMKAGWGGIANLNNNDIKLDTNRYYKSADTEMRPCI